MKSICPKGNQACIFIATLISTVKYMMDLSAHQQRNGVVWKISYTHSGMPANLKGEPSQA